MREGEVAAQQAGNRSETAAYARVRID